MMIDAEKSVLLLKALGDPTRLRVIEVLVDGPRHVGRINDSIGIEPSLLSHHLRVLKEAGLVRDRRDGKAVMYTLGHEVQESSCGRYLDLGAFKFGFPN